MADQSSLPDLILENSRARLEPLTLAHYDDLAPVALGQGLVRYSPYSIDTETSLREFLRQAEQERAAGERYAFAVFDKQARAYAGSSSYGFISWRDQRLEIGWTWLGRQFQGTGLNPAMKLLMLEFAFEQLGFERVELRTHHQNFRSQRAMEKIGAVYEGTLRSHMAMPDGSRRSSLYYSILRSEWPQVKEKLTSFAP